MTTPEPKILARTEQWLAVSKPAGWLTIPGRGPVLPVLLDWAENEAEGKVWVVHRIDRETSGVVLFARSADAHRQANQWFEKHQVRKSYDFLAVGNPPSPILKLNEAIEGRPSMTQVEVKERYLVSWAAFPTFLGRATPLSGRRHQIRIHLSKKGYPILGDLEYGGPAQIETGASKEAAAQQQNAQPKARILPISRVALHAAKLELPSGERFEAAWPEDFRSWVEALRGARS